MPNQTLQWVRREKEEVFCGLRDPPGNWVAPAGSSRSGGGGDEAVGAFDAKAARGRPSSVQAVTKVNSRRGPEIGNAGADPTRCRGRLPMQAGVRATDTAGVPAGA